MKEMLLQKIAGNEGAKDKRTAAAKEQGMRVRKIKGLLLQKGAGNKGAKDKRTAAAKDSRK